MEDILWNVQICHGSDEDGYTERSVTFDTYLDATEFVQDYLDNLDQENSKITAAAIKMWCNSASQMIEL